MKAREKRKGEGIGNKEARQTRERAVDVDDGLRGGKRSKASLSVPLLPF